MSAWRLYYDNYGGNRVRAAMALASDLSRGDKNPDDVLKAVNVMAGLTPDEANRVAATIGADVEVIYPRKHRGRGISIPEDRLSEDAERALFEGVI